MNIVDIVILLIMGIGVIIGIYNGFILTVLRAAGSLLSWLISLVFYPMVTEKILKRFPSLLNTVALYTEGNAYIPEVEDRMASIQAVTPEKLSSILDKINLPNPFNKMLLSDFSRASNGAETLGTYFDNTIAMTVINIFSFIILFFIVKLIFTIVTSIFRTVIDLPVLKKYEDLAGAGTGLVNGLFAVNFVFALVPILLILVPVNMIAEFMDSSKLMSFFLSFNIFTNFIKVW